MQVLIPSHVKLKVARLHVITRLTYRKKEQDKFSNFGKHARQIQVFFIFLRISSYLFVYVRLQPLPVLFTDEIVYSKVLALKLIPLISKLLYFSVLKSLAMSTIKALP